MRKLGLWQHNSFSGNICFEFVHGIGTLQCDMPAAFCTLLRFCGITAVADNLCCCFKGLVVHATRHNYYFYFRLSVILSFINTFITFAKASSRYPQRSRSEERSPLRARSGFEPGLSVQQANTPLSELRRTLLLLMYLLLLMLLFLRSTCWSDVAETFAVAGVAAVG